MRTALTRRHKRELRRVEEVVLVESLESLGSFYRDVLAARLGSGDAISNFDLVELILIWAASEAEEYINSIRTLPL